MKPKQFIRATDLVRIVLDLYDGYSLDAVTWTNEETEVEELPNGKYRLCDKP